MKKIILTLTIFSFLISGCSIGEKNDFKEVSKVDVEVSDYVDDKSIENTDEKTTSEKNESVEEQKNEQSTQNLQPIENNNLQNADVSSNQPKQPTSNNNNQKSVKENNTYTPQIVELNGKVICIDAAHGNFDSSVQEPIAPNSLITKPANTKGTIGAKYKEDDITLSVANKIKAILESHGAKVIMTRTDSNSTMTNSERAVFANDNGAEITVKLHADGSTKKSKGISVLSPGGGYISDKTMISNSSKLGYAILKNASKTSGAKNKGLTYTSNMTGLNWSNKPAVIVELGHLTNPTEEKKLGNSEYQSKLANGIVYGIMEYFK